MEGAASTFSYPIENLSSFHVLLLTETFCCDELELPGFFSISRNAVKPAIGRPMGGLDIAVNRQLNCKVIEKYSSDHLLAVNLVESSCSFVVAYFKPNTDLEDIYQELKNCLDNLSGVIFVGGDFNARRDSGNRGEELVHFMCQFGFICLNSAEESTFYCHNGESTIDLVFTNSPLRISSFSISPSCYTKHCQVMETNVLSSFRDKRTYSSMQYR